MTRSARSRSPGGETEQGDCRLPHRRAHRRVERIGRLAELGPEELEYGLLRARLRLVGLVGRNPVPEERQAPDPGQHRAEQLDPLARQLGLAEEHAGDVAARPREAPDVAPRDRIVVDGDHQDRQMRARITRRPQRGLGTDREQHVHPEPDQLAHQLREPIGLTVRIPEFDDEVLALHVTQLGQTAGERYPVR
ncbi:MAG TPA: hypothetical protein VFE48_08545 [Methylomirabilota bacterium]|nr:hypothetical protein [Methylomirabilota bacterium]